ncbi:sigma-70 family RNA polymerase sigma factor [Paraglaciecola aquimarina]|uniref:Sigma-70 family RNA polymerase sigma factor n=1 Tax=Paraglaciecola algarum TaxID=3050085 RepID=A0ABS9D303_9ALTE|nr:sigma-70 family RNA polymerase sigma factor [Paraglaciecola sp. G1-23]MCF2947308.1 sigma-70 family RNA polymerase sigma factor [Paraglaciecola sp. G1-23]
MKNAITRIFRAESGQLLSSLMYLCRDLDLAEDALQDACEQASMQWSKQTLPDNPGAWLHTVAKRKLIDKLRQSQTQANLRSLHSLGTLSEINTESVPQEFSEQDFDVPDERLRLIFTCCHPALNQQAQVALTLRTLCGLSVKEIARAYLTSEIAMSQRITRAKKKIKDAGISYSVPRKEQLPARLSSVLKVIYLIYNESYSAFESQTLTRNDLAEEAIRLSQLMLSLLPNAEVLGLAALLLLHHARSPARQSSDAGYIPLEMQDRKLWNSAALNQGRALLDKALRLNQPGPYQIQAAISALHAQAIDWQSTDWKQIHLLYKSLYKINPSPVVELNCAVSLAYSGYLVESYKFLYSLEQELQNYQPYYAARAELEIQLMDLQAAIGSLNTAIKLSRNNSERDFLVKKRNHLLSQCPD